MMTKRKLLLTTALFLLALITIRIIWIITFFPQDSPRAVRGELDLRGRDLTTSRALSLNGEWEFYPRELLMYSAGAAHSAGQERGFIQVPGNWGAALSSQTNSPFGYGTYRLRVLVDPRQGQVYGIRLPTITSASELYVNGRLLAKSGQPEQSAERYTARIVPYSASFAADGDEIDIVIQAANFDEYRFGGIFGKVTFGSESAVNRQTWFYIGMQLLVCVILMGHVLYAFILYLIGARQRGLITFALLMLSWIMSVLVSDDMMLIAWLPFNYEWTIKITFLSYLGTSALLIEFLRRLLSEYSTIRTFRWYVFLSLIFALYILPAPAKHLLHLFNLLTIFNLVSLVIGPVVTLRSAMKNSADTLFLFLGSVVILNNLIWGAAQSMGFIKMGYYPIDTIAAILTFATYWSKRYIRTFAKTEKLAAELQRADKLKDDFLANTSHELRNPLHGMLNIAQTVLDSEKHALSDKNAKNLELMITVGRRMSFMLNDLLDLTRLKEGIVRLQVQSVQVQAVASGVFDMLRFMTEGKPIRLVSEIPIEFPPVMADENRLIQILFNLVHNAIKFTSEGTVVIRAVAQDGKAYISVADTGAGMDTETLQRIFQPYEQGDSGMTAAPGGGLGLGLGICKQLVELHGETLKVSSAPGEGAVFTFALKLSDTSSVQLEMEAASALLPAYMETGAAGSNIQYGEDTDTPSSRSTDRPIVLAVDDDPLNLKVLEDILTAQSFDIVAVTSGKEALSQLSSRVWDLVITDVMMPHMSGYELTRSIRERYSSSELPILLLTARNKSEDIATGFLAGANDYVVKPADTMELIARVRALTDVHRSMRERLRMEAAWLQAQIQPHFLFNALNAIAALSDINLNRMRLLLDEFGNYLRSSFNFQNSEQLVPLEQELALVRSYLYIENERFNGNLDIVWEIDVGMRLKIPPLSIQPLVENAVRHGITRRSSGGKILIQITEYEDRSEATITDNGVGMDEETVQGLLRTRLGSRQGVGLLNIDRRLKQMYGNGLQIRSYPEQGTTVSFVVPK